MTKKLNLNRSPYFDDSKPSDKYYQILFRPGRAVQARELTQLQTLLQTQIERLGTHIFKQGSNVIPGTENVIRFSRGITFVKLPFSSVFPDYNPSIHSNVDIENAIRTAWVGKKIRVRDGVRQGLTATVLDFRGPDNITTGANTGEVRFFVNIISSSTNGEHSTFDVGDNIQIIDGTYSYSATVPVTTGTDKKVGTVASVQLQEGVYFYNGYFVYVDPQTLYIAPKADESADDANNQSLWNDLPTATIGLYITESIKTSQDDPQLLDNALGSPNYTAPGADRFHIDAKLTQIEYKTDENRPANFISLVEIVRGQITFMADAPEYAVLMDTLARRTYDESGDYIVDNLGIEIKSFLRDEEVKNNGVHELPEFQFGTPNDANQYGLEKFGVNRSVQVGDYYYPGTSFDTKNDATSFKNLCDSYLTARIDPGKAYVKGYEIRKLARSSLDIPKSRTTRYIDSAVVQTGLGSYVLVNDVSGNTVLPNFISVNLYSTRRPGVVVANSSPVDYTYKSSVPSDATSKIGTATIVKLEADPSSGRNVYRAYLSNIKMDGNNAFMSVKSICSTTENFYAHTQLITYALSGTITSTQGASDTSASVTGLGTKWKNLGTELLKANDYIYIESRQAFYKVVSNPQSDTTLKIHSECAFKSDGTTGSTSAEKQASNTISSGTTFFGTYSELKDATDGVGLLYPLPSDYVSTVSLKDAPTATDMQYVIEQLFDGGGAGLSATTSAGANPTSTITINIDPTLVATQKFDANVSTYKVVQKDASGNKKTFIVASSSAQTFTNTLIPAGTTYVELNSTLTQITFYFNNADAASSGATAKTYFIMVPVTKTGITARKKNLKKGSFDITTNAYQHEGNSAGVTTKGFVVAAASGNSEIHLNECDVYRITRIVASKDALTAPTNTKTLNSGDEDLSALYTFDNGQTDYEYGYGKVVLRPGFSKPAGQVRVEFDYFDHEDNSDYFSVNSYLHAGTDLTYDEIPYYTYSSGFIKRLSDCIDFRRKASEANDGKAPSDFFVCSYSAYNGRKDKIVLDSKTKNFVLLKGTPSDDPVSPEDSEYGMTLAEITHTPYGAGAKESCTLSVKDNRRYTMRDIGKLEKRIENLEYYTSLSMLEQETSNMKVTDANGNNRFKNGFLADSFHSFDYANTEDPSFSCSIDTALENVARPLVFSNHYNLEEDFANAAFNSTRESVRVGDATRGYVKIGNLYMLPFTRREFITQQIATKVTNVNPYAVFTYVGHVVLTPFSDVWRETKYSEIQVYDDAAYQAAMKLSNGEISYGQVVSRVVAGPAPVVSPTVTIVSRAGHRFTDMLSEKEKKKAIKRGYLVVPPGYYNSGDSVPIEFNRHGKVGKTTLIHRTTTTSTLRMEDIRSAFRKQVDKAGVQTTRALTRDETTEIEFMRSREVKFTGDGFRPNINLYAFFDDVNVSAHCRPMLLNDSQNYISCAVTDITNQSVVPGVGSLPVDSPIRYFQASGTTTVFPLGVAVGCEVAYTTASGITRKFDIVRLVTVAGVAGTSIIACQEKTTEGLLASQQTTLSTDAVFNIKISNYKYGAQLVADGTGSVYGVFKIPNEEGLRFKTGEAKFVLTSSSINAKTGSGISRGAADYSARGTLNTQEMTITQTQLFRVSTTETTEVLGNRDFPTESNQEIPEIVDPIAQTFAVKETGGCFITDVEVFFAKKSSSNIPIRLEIRPVSKTGQPEFSLVGGDLGCVIKKAADVVVNQVTINNTGSAANNKLRVLVDAANLATQAEANNFAKTVGGTVVMSGSTPTLVWNNNTEIKSDKHKLGDGTQIIANTDVFSTDMSQDMIPTRFTLPSPIYLEEGKSYAFVLLSDSNEYEVWVAQRGPYGPLDSNYEYGYYSGAGVTNVKIGTTQSIDNQELYVNGDFFKSKNGFGWQIDPTISIKFNLAKAQFQTNASTSNPKTIGEVNFVNQLIDWTDVPDKGLETRPGSSYIRVFCPNHGVSAGDNVRFLTDLSDVTQSDGLTTELRGFQKSIIQIDSGLPVVNTELDYFTVQVKVAGTTYSATNNNTPTTAGMSKDQYKFGSWKLNPSNNVKQPTVKIRINKKYDMLTLMSHTFAPQGTNIQWRLQTTNGVGVNEYKADGTLVTRSKSTKVPPISLTTNTPVNFDNSMLLCCPESEPTVAGAINQAHIHAKKSVIVTGLLYSENENLTPIISDSALSFVTMSNRLDNPQGVAGSEVGNIINNPGGSTFDTLVIFNSGAVPSDPLLVTSGGTTSIVNQQRTPTLAGVNILNGLTFSTATQVLSGSFTQAVNSKYLIPTNTTTNGLASEISVGDKIVSTTDLSDERTVVKVVIDETNTEVVKKIVLNSPFSTEIVSTDRIALIGQHLEITTNDIGVASHLSQLDLGKYMTLSISSTTGTDTRQFSNKKILDVIYTPNETTKCKIVVDHFNTAPASGGTDVTITQLDRYVDEVGYEGNSCATRYITKALNLDNPSNALKLSFDAIRNEYSFVDLYYRIELTNDSEDISQKSWTKAEYNILVDGVLTPKAPEPSDTVYRAYESTINSLPQFVKCQVKVVMRGGNPAKPPKIKNVRIIALDE